MRPLFQLLNLRNKLPFTSNSSALRNPTNFPDISSRLLKTASSVHKIRHNLFRQIVKPLNKSREASFSLAHFKNRQLHIRRKTGLKSKKKKVVKRNKLKPMFKQRLNKQFIFARLTKGVKTSKTTSKLKIRKPKSRRQRKKVLSRRILLAHHVRRLRRLLSRTLRYQQDLRNCMPRIKRIKRFRLQYGR